MRAFRIFGLSVRDLYEELFMFAGLNLLWWLCVLVIILIPPATAGLMYIGNELAHERRVEWRMFLTGARLYFWRSWQIAIVALGGAFILLTNVWFYVNATTGILQYLTILWIYLLIIWVAAQIYAFPLLIQMEQPRILLIYRNALLLTLSRPLFTVLLILLLLIATIIGGIFAIILILAIPGLWAIASNRALVHVLEEVRSAQSKGEESGKKEEKR
ncbi:MAG: hypothetical protein IT330_15010 [Anaerolineae bacterium]|nr:hypothetical protein [Anaerolineae bacterium]